MNIEEILKKVELKTQLTAEEQEFLDKYNEEIEAKAKIKPEPKVEKTFNQDEVNSLIAKENRINKVKLELAEKALLAKETKLAEYEARNNEVKLKEASQTEQFYKAKLEELINKYHINNVMELIGGNYLGKTNDEITQIILKAGNLPGILKNTVDLNSFAGFKQTPPAAPAADKTGPKQYQSITQKGIVINEEKFKSLPPVSQQDFIELK